MMVNTMWVNLRITKRKERVQYFQKMEKLYMKVILYKINMKDFKNGYRYIGEWKDGKRHGNGKMIDKDGKEYNGKFHDNEQVKMEIILY